MQYNGLSPNMLLYWTLLAYSCEQGARYFDFGRSTPDAGTYRFKEQWGAKPTPLHWHSISINGRTTKKDSQSEKSKFEMAVKYWKKLPVPISNAVGPLIRKRISL
jgi:CelD/BcsL family acetyltransferase involved in cellulose biosynthesis